MFKTLVDDHSINTPAHHPKKEKDVKSPLILTAGKLAAGLALCIPGLWTTETRASELDWLTGCWVNGDGSSQEVWIANVDGSFSGFSVALRENTVAFYELLNIDKNHDERWTYTAIPAGQSPTAFAAVEVNEDSALFSNPEHDYPQEIRYERRDNALLATISLIGGENPQSFDKVACE